MDTRDGSICPAYMVADMPAEDREHMRAMVLPLTSHQRAVRRVGRNDPCPCGSGRKFKRCCLLRSTVRPT